MAFHPIDFATWPRREHFTAYQQTGPCTFCMTVQLDVQAVRARAEATGTRFFPLLLHGLAQTVNAFREFRMGRDAAGTLGFYDVAHPSYTVFHPQTETFSALWTEYDPDWAVFCRRYEQDRADYGGRLEMNPKPAPENIFHVSCIPWASFTSFSLDLQNGFACYQPIFTIGRFVQQGEQLLLPLALQVHHAVCDGYHAAQFVNALQAWAAQC